ncbi:MAG: class I SAM-dependent methyltransferase [Gillisia sp.]
MQHRDNTKDVFGKAISAWYHKQDATPIEVHSPDFEDDTIPIDHLFRSYKEMPFLEKKALSLCKGSVLDIGCGAGSHSLFLQKNKNLQVTAIDISAGAIEISRKRGVENAMHIDFFELEKLKFNTLLLLMNGTGIIGKIENLDSFFQHAQKLLHPDGQILVDSSDLKYLFDEDEGTGIDPSEPYYGQLEFSISYKGELSENFYWLYLSFEVLKSAATRNYFSCELVQEGEHYDYLARLKPLIT